MNSKVYISFQSRLHRYNLNTLLDMGGPSLSPRRKVGAHRFLNLLENAFCSLRGMECERRKV